jgi:hypothetical protein
MPVSGTGGFMGATPLSGEPGTPSSFGAYSIDMKMMSGVDMALLEDPVEAQRQLELLNDRRRRRRESHNAVERRRRDNINEKISELLFLLPADPADGGQRPNKGLVLRRSVDYIRHIQSVARDFAARASALESVLRNVLGSQGLSEQGIGLPQGFLETSPNVEALLNTNLNIGMSSSSSSSTGGPVMNTTTNTQVNNNSSSSLSGQSMMYMGGNMQSAVIPSPSSAGSQQSSYLGHPQSGNGPTSGTSPTGAIAGGVHGMSIN